MTFRFVSELFHSSFPQQAQSSSIYSQRVHSLKHRPSHLAPLKHTMCKKSFTVPQFLLLHSTDFSANSSLLNYLIGKVTALACLDLNSWQFSKSRSTDDYARIKYSALTWLLDYFLFNIYVRLPICSLSVSCSYYFAFLGKVPPTALSDWLVPQTTHRSICRPVSCR